MYHDNHQSKMLYITSIPPSYGKSLIIALMANILLKYNSYHSVYKSSYKCRYDEKKIKKIYILCYNEYLAYHAYNTYAN